MLSERQLTGREDSHIEYDDHGVGLAPACRKALARLSDAARHAGFEIEIASGFRSFERQQAIWNAKASGERVVHDDRGNPVRLSQLDPVGKIHAIMRYSALPGASRHHWGSDLDVFDSRAMPAGYQLQLTPEEVADAGMFGPFHRWLDGRIAAGEAEGFYRPYQEDRGGVAPERWHISYAPLALDCTAMFSESLLEKALRSCELELREAVIRQLPDLYQRYVEAPLPL